MSLERLVLLLQLATTLPLVGLIWLIQVVSYPLFAKVGSAEFPAYHAAHTRLITFVVAPLMVVELGAALLALVWVDRALPRPLAVLGAALAIAAWLVTLFVSVPQHELLARGFDPRVHGLLVASNWLRTASWSARGALLLLALARER